MSSLQAMHSLHHQNESTTKAAQKQSTRSLFPLTLQRLQELSTDFWLLTKDDATTFVVPNTAFGMFGALAGSTLIIHSSATITVLARLPLVVFFNWSNLLIFDLANQRLPESATEDALNKPWRPVPSGRLTSSHLRRAMLFFIPIVLAVNHFALHVGLESGLLFILTWLYNDLGGGDEDWVLRNAIIAVAFGLYNAGSIKTAAGINLSQHTVFTVVGWQWIIMISGVIFTTMHVQDMKDVGGDRARGRRTAPIVLGDMAARWSIAVPVIFWSWVCLWFWKFHFTGLAVIGIGAIVAWRCINLKEKSADRRTWQLWAFWTAVLYTLPLWDA
jgi:4-hydroxybenzoate polyprenyltransferase